ncbi:hypothetical protein NQZ68_022398 [Dissostichus eleginoides]|nr:hypothetical protein NQZ68_022398 [Dissostichus eleginoides]
MDFISEENYKKHGYSRLYGAADRRAVCTTNGAPEDQDPPPRTPFKHLPVNSEEHLDIRLVTRQGQQVLLINESW